MKFKLSILLPLLFLHCQNIIAVPKFSVWVYNETGQECTLDTFTTYKGYNVAAPTYQRFPLPKGQWDISSYDENDGQGIAVTMTYQCGPKTITLNSSQSHSREALGVSFLGTPSADWSASSTGIRAEYSIEYAAKIKRSKPNILRWIIEK